jgi:hypothetical protein
MSPKERRSLIPLLVFFDSFQDVTFESVSLYLRLAIIEEMINKFQGKFIETTVPTPLILDPDFEGQWKKEEEVLAEYKKLKHGGKACILNIAD